MNKKIDVEIVSNLNSYCKLNGLDSSHMYAICNGKKEHHKNYKVRKLP